MKVGNVRPDGTSTLLPQGVYDMTAGAEPELSPEVEAKIAELTAGLDARGDTKAQFRLEVFFLGGPRKTVDVRGTVSIWTNGGYLHGGGDAAVYLCPQQVNGHDCMAPIDMQFMTSQPNADTGTLTQVVVCTECRRVSNVEDLTGQITYACSTQRWAHILAQLFHRLGCSADLLVSIERESLHRATELEMNKRRGGQEYARVQAKRECVTYPLAHIITDTARGVGFEQLFRAFLEA